MNTKAYIKKNICQKQKPVWTGKRQVLANVGQLQRLAIVK
jgi:ribosomal protein L31